MTREGPFSFKNFYFFVFDLLSQQLGYGTNDDSKPKGRLNGIRLVLIILHVQEITRKSYQNAEFNSVVLAGSPRVCISNNT